MEIRKTVESDLPRLMEIYDKARKFMRANGNMTQWINNYPSEELILADIAAEHSYVCVDEGEVVGTFAFIVGIDPTYLVIEQGNWLDDEPYGVIHRIASVKKGVGQFCINWAYEQTHSLRIDTHRDNIPMQRLVTKLGFVYCGIIHIADGSERLAYQKPCTCHKVIKQFEWANKDSHHRLHETYELLKKMHDEGELILIASDYPFDDFSKEISEEMHYTYSAYLKCPHCGKIYRLGVCVRGEPLYRKVEEADVEKFHQICQRDKREVYSDIKE